MMTLMKKLTLNFIHSPTHALVKVKVSGSVQPMGLTASGCSPSCIVMPHLSHDVMSSEYARASPNVFGTLEPLFLWGGPILIAKPKWQ